MAEHKLKHSLADLNKNLATISSGIIPKYCSNRCLSIVRTCSSKIIEFLSNPSKLLIRVCVGSFALVFILLVIGATRLSCLSSAYNQ